ncbi:hypothetical protein [Granulicella sp. dw_53]|uniref:hypothetical protein n=1 Tax=Granulicella sp. dw_53 TaxID=2719792 RepID=UPI0021031312|nr:hypothetical protein [Granulicella sp. dw_53]
MNGLALEYPKVQVKRDPIYLRDGRIYTSAGITAGIDLSLALVEEDQGHEVSLEIARFLVMFLVRPGGRLNTATCSRTRRPLRSHYANSRCGCLNICEIL